MAGEVKEKCAVAAVLANDGEPIAAGMLYESLFAMQHRGTEASGIAAMQEDYSIRAHCGLGMVRDVYNQETIQNLGGVVGVGHNRYSTSGSKIDHPQPIRDTAIGFAFAHNGNLPVTDELEQDLQRHGIHHRNLNDSEMAGLSIAQNIRQGLDLPTAVEKTYPLMHGAFSCVAMHDGSIVAFRDPHGIRPLAIGRFDGGYVVSSETCGLDIVDATYEREVEPGEVVVITNNTIESYQLAEPNPKLDMFEFVYFARHDSQLYGQSVNEVRRKMGQQLAEEHGSIVNNTKNALVVPVPDTSIPAAEGYAERLGLLQRQAIIKNRYIGRTFIQPSNSTRRKNLRRKHNIIPEAVQGKDVILMDDSIVRLNTIPRLVALAKQAGARTVSVLIASPPVRYPDHYGIDTPHQKELAAAVMTVEQMRERIDCEYLGFLSLTGLVKATGMPADMFNLSCFNGEYPVDIGCHADGIQSPVSMEYVD